LPIVPNVKHRYSHVKVQPEEDGIPMHPARAKLKDFIPVTKYFVPITEGHQLIPTADAAVDARRLPPFLA
jgi:hypothetical protein